MRDNKKDGTTMSITKATLQMLDEERVRHGKNTGKPMSRSEMARLLIAESICRRVDSAGVQVSDPYTLIKLKTEQLQTEINALVDTAEKMSKEVKANEPI